MFAVSGAVVPAAARSMRRPPTLAATILPLTVRLAGRQKTSGGIDSGTGAPAGHRSETAIDVAASSTRTVWNPGEGSAGRTVASHFSAPGCCAPPGRSRPSRRQSRQRRHVHMSLSGNFWKEQRATVDCPVRAISEQIRFFRIPESGCAQAEARGPLALAEKLPAWNRQDAKSRIGRSGLRPDSDLQLRSATFATRRFFHPRKGLRTIIDRNDPAIREGAVPQRKSYVLSMPGACGAGALAGDPRMMGCSIRELASY